LLFIILISAAKDDRISTTSIGDGGNELGMGKVKNEVEKYVEHGEQIACVVSCDYLITAGVSNWGGYAIAVGLHVLSTCPIHVRYVRRGLAKVEEEEKGKEEFLNSVEQVRVENMITYMIRYNSLFAMTYFLDVS
jgi:hypothetical protein